MKISVKKDKGDVRKLTGNNKLKIHIDGQQVEQVSQFRYLGSSIQKDGYYTKEIRSGIEMAKKNIYEEKRKCLLVKLIWNQIRNNEALGLVCCVQQRRGRGRRQTED